MIVFSNWKLQIAHPTAGLVTILNWGSQMLGELVFTGRYGMEIVELESADPRIRATKVKVYDFTLPIIGVAATDADARLGMMRTFSAFDDLDPVAMRLDIQGITSAYFYWSAAYFHTPVVRRLMPEEGPDGAFLQQLSITAVGYQEVAVP
jgi:hypothetical protein